MPRTEEIARLPGHPWFHSVPEATLFAVRSSGIAEDSADDSFAGVHETELNVARDRILDVVRKCRRSGDSDQARALSRGAEPAERRRPHRRARAADGARGEVRVLRSP